MLLLLALCGSGVRQYYHSRRLNEAPAAESIEPAERALREAVRQHPRNAAAPRELGLYLLARRQPCEAMWSFQDALDRRPGDATARLGLARALIVAQLPQLALKTLANGHTVPSPIQTPKSKIQNTSGVRSAAAAAYLAMGDPIATIAVLRSAGSLLDRSAPDLLTLGIAAEALGDDPAAAGAYERCLRSAPGEGPTAVEAELGLGRVAARARRWPDAFALLEQARQAAPDDPRPLYQLGLTLQARGRHEPSGKAADSRSGSAIRFFEQSLAIQPDFGPAHLQIGLWDLQHRRPAAAVPHLAKAAAAGAGGAETLRRLAGALDGSGQAAAACYQRGAYFMLTQQPGRAAQEYQQMDRLEPGRPDALLLLITAYAKMEKMSEAAEVAARAVQRFPDDPQVLARRAMLLLSSGSQSEGAQLCRRWLQRHAGAGEPYRLLGSLERAQGHPAEAVGLCDQAMARDPRNAEFCRETARALVETPTPANLRRAVMVLRRALALDSRDAEAFLQLGDALQGLGDRDGARDQYLRSMDRNLTDRRPAVALLQLCPRVGQSSRVSFYSQIVRALHERESAAQTLWRQVFRVPGDADAHTRLAALLLEATDLPQARYQLEQVLELRPDRQAVRRQAEIVERLLTLREE